MKTGLKSIIIVAVMASGLFCVALAHANEHRAGTGDNSGMRHMDDARKDEFFKDLDLTGEQRDKVKAHREETKKEMKALHDQMRAKRLELKAELDKPAPDNAKVAAITSELKNLSGQMIDSRVNSILSLKAILTPEQFKKMSDRMEKKKGQWNKGKCKEKCKE